MLFPHATKYMDFLTTSFLVHCHQLDVQQFNSILALNYLESVQTAEGLNARRQPPLQMSVRSLRLPALLIFWPTGSKSGVPMSPSSGSILCQKAHRTWEEISFTFTSLLQSIQMNQMKNYRGQRLGLEHRVYETAVCSPSSTWIRSPTPKPYKTCHGGIFMKV